MIARHETDVFGVSQGLQPSAGEMKFRWKTDIGDVPGDRDMAWMMGSQIRHDLRKDVHIMGAGAGAFPVQIAGHPLADEVTPAQTWQGPDMRVGQMGKKNFHAANVLLFAARQAATRKFPTRLTRTFSKSKANGKTNCKRPRRSDLSRRSGWPATVIR